ncbi:molybdenum cofactor guanylyltransferase [Synechococcus sp. MU1617]|uniref:molybdenum cofactor guanylyltransferase n=1 Tax=Synechococcus sp. MU1617 TaxID=2508346 RepID=UPI002105EBE0|nr:molybdenum cofactor guanylyltransferase [Synechococcus sp. MU1617]
MRVCLLSGGSSRRMGRDKALLPHPSGGVWLTALVDQLLPLGHPVQVLSRHAAHAELLAHRPGCSVLLELPPWNGPLQALAKVLSPMPGEALLVLPVDMPLLRTAVVQQLIAAWNRAPEQASVAHDGQRLQPLLAVIPSGSPFRSCLDQQLQRGELRWMDWLTRVPHQTVRLPAEALLNANCPADLAALEE